MKLTVLAILLFMFTGCGTSPSTEKTSQGFDVGSGGEGAAGEFVQVGYELVEILTVNPVAGVSTEDLYKAVKSTKVIATKDLVLSGQPVDAINYRNANPARIEIDEEKWRAAKRHNRVLLAFHEYLGILGIDDNNYQVSRRIDRANICTRTPVMRKAIENALRKSCYRIVVDDLNFITSLNLMDSEAALLKVGDFDYLYGLNELSLSGASLSDFSEAMFKDLESLKTISVVDFGSLDEKTLAYFNAHPDLREVTFVSSKELKSNLWTHEEDRRFSHVISPKLQNFHCGYSVNIESISRGVCKRKSFASTIP